MAIPPLAHQPVPPAMPVLLRKVFRLLANPDGDESQRVGDLPAGYGFTDLITGFL